jgi:tRNA (cmo5U34)-methyltransferase
MFYSDEDSERRRKFFYAEQEAGMYDQTIKMVVPQYDLMHQTMIDLLKYHFGIFDDNGLTSEDINGVILDIGSGTGAESIAVLKEFPNVQVVALDLCEPMGIKFKENYGKVFGENSSFEERCKFIQGDILDNRTIDQLRRNEFSRKFNGCYLGIISAFTLHHLDTPQKKRAYQIIYDLLQVGGIMLNGDLFKYESMRLSRYVHNYDLRWIEQQFSMSTQDLDGVEEINKVDKINLSDAWRNHYLFDNKLDSIEKQMDMLNKIGYRDIGNPFSFWQIGILHGLKCNGI